MLHSRVERWIKAAAPPWHGADLVAGIIPRATGITDPEMARALGERADAMERRARALLDRGIQEDAPWLKGLGHPPTDNRERSRWMRNASVVTAYRERWSVEDGHRPLGRDPDIENCEQAAQRLHAQAAVEACRALRPVRRAGQERAPAALPPSQLLELDADLPAAHSRSL